MQFIKRTNCLVTLISALWLSVPHAGPQAQSTTPKTMTIRADSWEIDGQAAQRQMTGNIVAKYGPLSLKAATLTEKTKGETKILYATGNPIIVETYDDVTKRQVVAVANKIEYRVQDKKLLLTKRASIQIKENGDQEILITGQLIQLIHDDRRITHLQASGEPVTFKQATPKNTIEATAEQLTLDEISGLMTMKAGHMQRGVDQFSFPFLRYNTRTGDLEASAEASHRPELHFSGNQEKTNH